MFFLAPIPIPALLYLVVWFVMQNLNAFMALGSTSGGGIAYSAHIVGFLTGFLVGGLFRFVGVNEAVEPD